MGAILCEFESRPPHSISHKETSKEVSFFVMSLLAHKGVYGAQRKIPVVFNIGQKKGSISGRHLGKPASGQKNGLFYGRHRHKAGIANGQQTVQWTFAVSGALWHSSRSLL